MVKDMPNWDAFLRSVLGDKYKEPEKANVVAVENVRNGEIWQKQKAKII